MKLLVAAVAARPPDWVVAGWNDYAKRMPRELPLELVEIRPEPRTTGKTPAAMMALPADAAAEAHFRGEAALCPVVESKPEGVLAAGIGGGILPPVAEDRAAQLVD